MPALQNDDFIDLAVNAVCIAMCSIQGSFVCLFVCDEARYSVTYLPGNFMCVVRKNDKNLVQGLKVITWLGRKEKISMA